MRSVIAVVIALSCAGCGSASAVDGGRSTAPPYKGPLTAGAAVDALECDGTKPFLRSTGEYDDGLATVQSSAQDAFDNYIEESSIGYSMPLEGYRIERNDTGHALLSYDVGERTKVSVVVADGIRDWDDDVGWGVVAWAQCDPAEFPAEVTDGPGHRRLGGRVRPAGARHTRSLPPGPGTLLVDGHHLPAHRAGRSPR